MAAYAIGFVNNWQAGKTLTECNLRMLQEEDSCDVTFRCGTEGHVVKAHRYMLISRSCVFHAMLTGAMAEKSDVKIPDIEAPVFKTFLKYIYTDDTDIDAYNVTALLYVARKYGVSSFETKCVEFLENNLCYENACVILQAAHCFDQKQLFEKTLTLIKTQGDRSLSTPGFLSLSQAMVDKIVGSDDLEADEHVIFKAVNDWSGAECEREGREVTPKSKRAVLGDVLMKVRFPLMEPAFLADGVKRSGLLSNEERLSFLDFSVLPEGNSTHLRHKKRLESGSSNSVSPSRFLNIHNWWVVNGEVDAISFSSSSNLFLLGCQLYGAYKDGRSVYKVTSYCGDEDNVLSCVVQEETEHTCDDEGGVFDVIFSHPVSVSAAEWYTLAVRVTGPDTWNGEEGQERIVCDDGVELQFRKSCRSKNFTDSKTGQIPSLIYRQCQL